MITLNASGGSVTFTFSGNSTYLNDGTIEVPVNSLALIIDESDMVTFKKSQSSDIFVSANIAEFGMTKDELMAWYKANMVGSTGGGGGVTPEEFEAYSAATDSRIAEDEEVTAAGLNAINDRLSEDEEVTAAGLNSLNEALSGKADANDVYTQTEVDTLLMNKADASALGGMTIVKITESEYAALVDKDPNVLYVVIPDPTNP